MFETLDVRKYAMQWWVTRQAREDGALNIETLLAEEMYGDVIGEGYRPLTDTLTIEWHDRDTDPMVGGALPEGDPRVEAWNRGELFMVLGEVRCLPARR